MGFQYDQIEAEVVTRLQTYITTGYDVKQMPEKENQYTVVLNKALIVVAYSDSLFDPPVSTDIIKQTENVTILCNIKSPRLRGNFSVQEGIQLMKQILLGFKPSNLSKLILEKIEFLGRDEANNFFEYNISFRGKKLQVEVEDPTIYPLLQSVTFNNEYTSPQFY